MGKKKGKKKKAASTGKQPNFHRVSIHISERDANNLIKKYNCYRNVSLDTIGY